MLLSTVKKSSHLHRSSTIYKTKLIWVNKYVSGFWCERTTVNGLFHWRKRYYFSWKQLEFLNDGFVSYKHSFTLHKTLTDGLEWCGLLVDYCDVFISCLDSHSDGTHSLQSIHWWDSDEMTFLQTWWRNKLIYILNVDVELIKSDKIWSSTTVFNTDNNQKCFWISKSVY